MRNTSSWNRGALARPIARPTASKPAPIANFFDSAATPDPLERFALLPLRAFVGATFAYAGLQKLADPGYLDPDASTYLGSQLQAFAGSSPLGFLISWLALPRVQFIGQAVIVAEIGVGLLVLAGLFTRAAAIIGALLSVLLFLWATWDVQPYFLGSDTIYAVAWVTLALAGDGGVFSLEMHIRGKLRKPQVPQVRTLTPEALNRRTLLLRAGGGLVGLVWLLAILPKSEQVQAAPPASAGPVPTPADPFHAQSSVALNPQPSAEAASTISSSPSAQAGSAASSGSPASVPANVTPSESASASTVLVQAVPTRAPATIVAIATPAPPRVPTTVPSAAPAPTGTPIATMARLQRAGGALTFADRLTGEPGIVVDLGAGKVAACSAICTHAGCTVEYAARQRLLVCPCHGAVFDPAQSGRVLRGPARRPLRAIPVAAAANGTIYLRG